MTPSNRAAAPSWWHPPNEKTPVSVTIAARAFQAPDALPRDPTYRCFDTRAWSAPLRRQKAPTGPPSRRPRTPAFRASINQHAWTPDRRHPQKRPLRVQVSKTRPSGQFQGLDASRQKILPRAQRSEQFAMCLGNRALHCHAVAHLAQVALRPRRSFVRIDTTNPVADLRRRRPDLTARGFGLWRVAKHTIQGRIAVL